MTVVSAQFLKSSPKRVFLGKGPFCKVHAGAGLFRDEKVPLQSSGARLGALAVITKKKEGARATVMRFCSRRLLIFLNGIRKKIWEMLVFPKYSPERASSATKK